MLRRILAGPRPVVDLTFALNYSLGGMDVGGYHLLNLAIHLLAALTLFGVVRRTLELPARRAAVRRTGLHAGRVLHRAALDASTRC